MTINKYKIKTTNGYVSGFYMVLEGEYDYEGQMADYPNACKGWTKFVNGKFVEDETKKAEIEGEEAKQTELATLHKDLSDSDYLVARTFEQVMALENPLTFISDLIKITKEFREKYAETIANRETWRKRIEELENK